MENKARIDALQKEVDEAKEKRAKDIAEREKASKQALRDEINAAMEDRKGQH